MKRGGGEGVPRHPAGQAIFRRAGKGTAPPSPADRSCPCRVTVLNAKNNRGRLRDADMRGRFIAAFCFRDAAPRAVKASLRSRAPRGVSPTFRSRSARLCRPGDAPPHAPALTLLTPVSPTGRGSWRRGRRGAQNRSPQKKKRGGDDAKKII